MNLYSDARQVPDISPEIIAEMGACIDLDNGKLKIYRNKLYFQPRFNHYEPYKHKEEWDVLVNQRVAAKLDEKSYALTLFGLHVLSEYTGVYIYHPSGSTPEGRKELVLRYLTYGYIAKKHRRWLPMTKDDIVRAIRMSPYHVAEAVKTLMQEGYVKRIKGVPSLYRDAGYEVQKKVEQLPYYEDMVKGWRDMKDL